MSGIEWEVRWLDLRLRSLRFLSLTHFTYEKQKRYKMRLVIEERNVHLLYIRESYLDTFMEEALVNLSHLP